MLSNEEFSLLFLF